jgi:hypothetical protein
MRMMGGLGAFTCFTEFWAVPLLWAPLKITLLLPAKAVWRGVLAHTVGDVLLVLAASASGYYLSPLRNYWQSVAYPIEAAYLLASTGVAVAALARFAPTPRWSVRRAGLVLLMVLPTPLLVAHLGARMCGMTFRLLPWTEPLWPLPSAAGDPGYGAVKLTSVEYQLS